MNSGSTPFAREQLLSVSYDEMRRMISETEPGKPSTRLNTLGEALINVAKHRQVEPAELFKIVRGDLDWIVMKSMEKDRSRRYETANELAMDIQRYLGDEPVVAGPPRTVYRLRKFVRRHKAGVLFGLSVAATMLIGLCLTTVGFVQASRERDRTRQARDRADVNFQMAREAVDEMTRVAEQELANAPGMEQVRRELLQKAQIFYEGFLEENENDPAIREETGWAYERLGLIHKILGNYDQSEQAIRQAISFFDALSTRFPNRDQYRRSLASALWNLGVIFKNHIRDKEEALKIYRRSFGLRAELVEEFPNEPAYVSDLAWSHVDLGLVLSDLGRYREAIAELRQALFLRKQLVDRFPNHERYLEALAHSHHWLGSRLYDSGQLKGAEQHFRDGLALRKRLLAEGNEDVPPDLVHIQNYLGTLLIDTGQIGEAVRILSEAADSAQKQAADFPRELSRRKRPGEVYKRLGEALFAAGLLDEAEDAMRKALAVHQDLAAEFPGHWFEKEVADRHRKLGLILQGVGRNSEAEQSLRRAVETQESLVSLDPNRPGLCNFLARYKYQLGSLLYQAGGVKEAGELFGEALGHFEKSLGEYLGRFPYRWIFAEFLTECPDARFHDPNRAIQMLHDLIREFPESEVTWRVLGGVYCRAGQWQASIEALERAMELRPNGSEGRDFFLLAIAYWQLGNADEAYRWYEEAVKWKEENRPGGEIWGRYQRLKSEVEELLGLEAGPVPSTKDVEQ
ncbi:MAG: tetratricopeptide repeat protein [Planctomycetota bacterium]|jgi:tetratricopeptide (TPR) repeat protein